MYCSNCGKQIPEQSAFCAYCGSQQSASKSSNKEIKKTGKIVCPKCEKDDQIQKVTSIRTGGVSTTNYGNIYGGRETATSATHLASRLSPPTNTYNMSSCGMWIFTSIIPWGIRVYRK